MTKIITTSMLSAYTNGKKMNNELINELKAERESLYPHGCPTRARGCGKVNLYITQYLRYMAYDVVCDIYEKIDRKVSLENAHDDMNYFTQQMFMFFCE